MIDFDALVLAPADAAFAEQVTWLVDDYPSALVPGIFFDGVIDEHMKDDVLVAERVTVLNVRESNFPRRPRVHDRFQVQGRLYEVVQALPDGLGAISCALRLTNNTDASRPFLAPVAAAA